MPAARVRQVDDHVFAGRHAGDVDVLAVEEGRVAVDVAARRPLLDPAELGPAGAAIGDDPWRSHVRHVTRGTAVAVDQAEAALAVAHEKALSEARRSS